MVIQLYTHSSLRNFTYLVEGQQGFYCIDPFDAAQVLDHLPGKLIAIINTHEHWDHTQGNSELVSKTGCQVWAHENAKGKIEGVDRLLSKGEVLELGNQSQFVVMDTPGHTHAHLCLLLKERGKALAVFTGDTLFNAGVGNCHNGGDPEVLFKTISEQFQNLNDDILVYPGHEYLGNNLKFTLNLEPSNQNAIELTKKYTENNLLITNMKTEREINSFLRLDNREIINNLKGNTDNNKQVFLRLRELRNNW
jgi:hydroxyacylglutathione hydrolase